ncbi:transposase, IS4 family protein, partial [Citreicella sp. 357]
MFTNIAEKAPGVWQRFVNGDCFGRRDLTANKVLFKLPLRQTTGMVASRLQMAGLDWPVPDYSTLCRRQKTLAVQIACRRADGPLNLLVPSRDIA